jgi:hypothetical protein
VVLGEAREHAADLGEVGARTIDAADEQRGERIALRGHALRLRERLAHESAAPQGQAATGTRVGLDGGAHAIDDERGLAEVVAHREHQRPGVLVDVRRDLAVEVRADAVTDIGLDHALEPVARRRLRVILPVGTTERGHGLGRIRTQLHEAVPQREEVAVLRRGHSGERSLVVDVIRHRGIRGDALEGRELTVGEHPEQVDHRCAVLRIGLERTGVRHGALRLASAARYSWAK